LYQTFLDKYLAFLDFKSLRETGTPILGLKYKAMERGPVPEEIYNKRNENISNYFSFKKDQDGVIIVHKKDPDLDYFSPYEINLMKQLIEIYAQNYIHTKIISDASHEDILAWKRTWKTKPNSIIDYSLEFEGNILKKSDKELSYPEENYLINMALEC